MSAVFAVIATAVSESAHDVDRAAKTADGLHDSLTGLRESSGAGRGWGKSLMSRPSLTLRERRWRWRR